FASRSERQRKQLHPASTSTHVKTPITATRYHTLEDLTGWKSPAVTPQDRTIDLGRLTLVKPNAHVMYYEPGKQIAQHYNRFAAWAALGGDIEIGGQCTSACTIVMIAVPRERICFSGIAHLGFHKATNNDGTIAVATTERLIRTYPADIRAW